MAKKNENENFVEERVKEPAPVLIGLETFCAMKNLPFTTKARLEYEAKNRGVTELTAEGWEAVLGSM